MFKNKEIKIYIWDINKTSAIPLSKIVAIEKVDEARRSYYCNVYLEGGFILKSEKFQSFEVRDTYYYNLRKALNLGYYTLN